MSEARQFRGPMRRNVLLLMMLLGFLATLFIFTGNLGLVLVGVGALLSEGGLAAGIVLAAGGFGYLVIRLLAPKDCPLGLRVVTACALGLWMLSSAMLAVGSFTHGAMTRWIWWPVIAVGALLAGWQGRHRLESWRPTQEFDARSLLAVAFAIVAAIWVAGAAIPPGYIGLADSYDVLEYHLQVPREFYDAGHIGELQHNCYSYYPLGSEMLFLLAMCLRGGPYAGAYSATMLHGLFLALAVAGVLLALRKDDPGRSRFAAGILATTPILVYLSWMAMVELAQLCYLTLGLLWLREWFLKPSARSAAVIGVLMGAACAVKYLSVGLVAGPVLAVMLLAALPRRSRLPHVALAAALAAAVFSPWLIRNTIYTGNPVFPLATEIFGRGHWSAESQARWQAGHAPGPHDPVPVPAGYEPRPARSQPEMLWDNLLSSQKFGQITMALAALGACIVLASRRADRPWWDLALLGVLAGQIAVWTLFTRDMPDRFIAVAVAPLSLLAGSALRFLANLRQSPFHRSGPVPDVPWGRAPAVIIFALGVVAPNFVVCHGLYRQSARTPDLLQAPPEKLTWVERLHLADPQLDVTDQSKFLLLGDAAAFYFPKASVYATAFDTNPLARWADEGLTGRQILDRLRQMGLTHIWVNWQEIIRLSYSYGYPSALSEGLYERFQQKAPPDLPVLETLTAAGTSRSDLDSQMAASRPAPNHPWPVVSLLTMPWAVPPATAPASHPATAASRP